MTNSQDQIFTTGGRKEIVAWALYDWANSAYSTISITVLVFYIQLEVVPGKWGPTVWAWGVSLSMLTSAILSPIVGAIADANSSKRKWLAGTAMSGALSAILLSLVPVGWTWVIIGLFVTASLMFELSLGVYNGFLPEIADENTMNRVSAWGYAVGYLGGAFALIIAIAIQKNGPALGLHALSDQLRAGLFVMGAWWGGFTLPAILVLKDRRERSEATKSVAEDVARAIREVGNTLASVRLFPVLAWFLLGFLLYNDGIQTVISQASTFAIKALDFKTAELIGLVLMIQIVALPGAIMVGMLADWVGQKATLITCLITWIGLVVAAYFVEEKSQFWCLGAMLALVLGGTQSVSRSIMGLMTPKSHTAEFFGFFNLSGKATSVLGTFMFGLIVRLYGDPRLAILSLLPFFVAGLSIMSWINIKKGRLQAERQS